MVKDCGDSGIPVLDSQNNTMEVCLCRTLLFICKANLNTKIERFCLYKALMGPRQDYCTVYWAPSLRKNINVLDAVQRRFTNTRNS